MSFQIRSNPNSPGKSQAIYLTMDQTYYSYYYYYYHQTDDINLTHLCWLGKQCNGTASDL